MGSLRSRVILPRIASVFLAFIWLATALAGSARSQGGRAGLGDQDSSFPGTYAIRSGPEDLLQIDVQIWGQVNRPGQYSVPDRTNLIGLISWAGGPTESAKLKEILVVRPLAEQNRVHEVNIESFLRSGDPSLIPRLTPGDVVVVPATRSHSLTRWVGFVSVAALVANVAVLATRN